MRTRERVPDLGSWLTKLTMADSPEFADTRVRQKLYFFLIANAIGVPMMLWFGVVLAFRGAVLIPITDFAGAALLLFAYIYLRITKKLFTTCCIAAAVFIGFLLVHLISGGTDSSGPIWYFIFPPVALYLLGLRLGLALSLIVAAPAMVILIMLFAGSEMGGYTTTFMLRFILSYLVETLLFFIMESQRTKAQQEVKILSGLLPICAACKKIRDDKGYWNQIEGYIQRYSDARFSHSVCPDCASKLYPDLDISTNVKR